MSTEKYEIVVVGGGHNGLVVAAYLARAGLSVCVVERQDIVGGTVATRDLTLPGFKHEVGAYMHGLIQANPLIRLDELKLKSKYGLKYIYPEKMFEAVFPDGHTMCFYRDLDKTCESIAQFSERDAASYRSFFSASNRMLKIASVAMFSPGPKWGAMMAFLDASEEGREFTRMILSSSADITEEWFENDDVKVAITRFASEMMISPYEVGTGNAMFFVSSLHLGGYGLVEGGSGNLCLALAAAIWDNGGVIKLASPVKSIRVNAGEATGVILENGEEILATRGVVSNVNVKQLFLDMLDQSSVKPEFAGRVRRIRPSAFSAINIAIACKEAPAFKSGNLCDAMFTEINPPLDEYRRIFEDYSRGISSTRMPLLAVPTIYDPTRAPAGQHTIYLYHYEPFHLSVDGPDKWDGIKQAIADGIIQELINHIDKLDSSNILGMKVLSPLDIQRYNPAMPAGDIMHISSSIAQSYGNRPLAGWGQYRTPVNKLYMCGASTHPGGGVTGGGRGTALLIMEDLGIDYKKVVGK